MFLMVDYKKRLEYGLIEQRIVQSRFTATSKVSAGLPKPSAIRVVILSLCLLSLLYSDHPSRTSCLSHLANT